ncbi:hypothetical protein [Mucilaginibacter sp.]|uniref:hypothetical protein n=1 Tax=Mucilaginibacter sp. TaxID=1882438 RepID=UPI003264AE1B
MKVLKIIVLAVSLVSFKNTTATSQEKLEKKTVTITVTYGYVGCTCAQWVINNSNINKPQREYIYLEPANDKLKDADKQVDGTHVLKVKITGHFYLEKGYPENYNPAKGRGDAARIFRYDKIKIVR